MSPTTQLVLAGKVGHALLLRRWAMRPKKRPKGLITLVNRSSTTPPSGAGLIAGFYSSDEVAIDLRHLAAEAGVAFVQADPESDSPARLCSSRADCLCPSLF